MLVKGSYFVHFAFLLVLAFVLPEYEYTCPGYEIIDPLLRSERTNLLCIHAIIFCLATLRHFWEMAESECSLVVDRMLDTIESFLYFYLIYYTLLALSLNA